MTVPIFIIFCFRFSSVAGYNVNKLKGVSFFDLIHAADIGPVMKAFKNCKLYIKGGPVNFFFSFLLAISPSNLHQI